jgi:hypothetical protein
MLLIYSASSSSRLTYIFDLIFRDILGAEYELTNNAEYFRQSSSPKLSYSDSALADELFFQSTSLVFEKGISPQNISVFDWNSTKAFFPTSSTSTFPFDPFAASFYLVSRYEEYLPHKRDSFNRYDETESLAYKNNFLQKPLVNIWANKIKDSITQHYPDFPFPSKKYQFISTIDIDSAYAYKHKGLTRTAGGFAKDILKLNIKNSANRISTLIGLKRDAYDTYDELSRIQNKYQFPSIYFFLLGDFGDKDKNLPASSKQFQSLIKSISQNSDCGIHPSFASNSHPEKITTEINRLKNILGKSITKSRQHFLMLTFPETYRNLIANNITDDYTLGYAGNIGFRASICTTFYFYDLQKEETTTLRLHPFAIMDATLNRYLKLKPEEALSHIEPLINEVKNVKGTFISLWHNESLSNIPPWKGWKDVYEQMIKIACEKN